MFSSFIMLVSGTRGTGQKETLYTIIDTQNNVSSLHRDLPNLPAQVTKATISAFRMAAL